MIVHPRLGIRMAWLKRGDDDYLYTATKRLFFCKSRRRSKGIVSDLNIVCGVDSSLNTISYGFIPGPGDFISLHPLNVSILQPAEKMDTSLCTWMLISSGEIFQGGSRALRAKNLNRCCSLPSSRYVEGYMNLRVGMIDEASLASAAAFDSRPHQRCRSIVDSAIFKTQAGIVPIHPLHYSKPTHQLWLLRNTLALQGRYTEVLPGYLSSLDLSRCVQQTCSHY